MKLRTIALVGLCLIAIGCGSSSLPPETDAAQGREMLTSVLEAWRAGKAPSDLQSASPPVVAHDPDWAAGKALTNYSIAAQDGRAGVDLLLRVTLQLKAANGSAEQKTVNYTVTIGSNNVVLRSD